MVENKPESQIHPPGSSWEQLIQRQPPRQPQQRYRSLAPRFTRGVWQGLRAAGAGQPPRAQLLVLAAPRSLGSALFSHQRPLNAVLARWRPGSFQSTVLPRCMATNSAKPAPAPATEQSSASLPRSGTTRLGFAAPTPPLCRDTGPQGQHRVAGCPGKRRATYGHHQSQNHTRSQAFPPPSYPTAPAEARSGWFENK